jgi:hypothetical protein
MNAMGNIVNQQDFDVVGFIMDFESASLSRDDVVEGFQHLIDSGIVWQLQGFYGRIAQQLIDEGHCVSKKELH